MIIDEPGLPGVPYIPPKPKPKPKPKPRPASRPPGVAAPYRPKQKGTSPLKPANFSTITASARSRVTNTYAPASLVVPGGPAPAPSGYKSVGPSQIGPTAENWKNNPLESLNAFAASGWGAAMSPSIYPLTAMIFDKMTQAKAAADAAKAKAAAGKGRSGGGSGYYPRAYYGGGSGGGGGGGGGGSEFERYGMTKDWMQAYKTFWGHALPREFWGMFSPVQELFSRYQSRLPQLDDWQRIWQAAKDYQVGAGKDAKNMPKNLALYEPWIAQGVRPPLFTPPAVSYAPFLSF